MTDRRLRERSTVFHDYDEIHESGAPTAPPSSLFFSYEEEVELLLGLSCHYDDYYNLMVVVENKTPPTSINARLLH